MSAETKVEVALRVRREAVRNAHAASKRHVDLLAESKSAEMAEHDAWEAVQVARNALVAALAEEDEAIRVSIREAPTAD